MESNARLIYKSYMTYFHTFLPVYFYGMPNGKVYCIYARFYENSTGNSSLEFVFAEHEDLTYDYGAGKIISLNYSEISLQGFIEIVDKPEQRIRELKVYGNIASYAEAQEFLNTKAKAMVHTLAFEQVI